MCRLCWLMYRDLTDDKKCCHLKELLNTQLFSGCVGAVVVKQCDHWDEEQNRSIPASPHKVWHSLQFPRLKLKWSVGRLSPCMAAILLNLTSVKLVVTNMSWTLTAVSWLELIDTDIIVIAHASSFDGDDTVVRGAIFLNSLVHFSVIWELSLQCYSL